MPMNRLCPSCGDERLFEAPPCIDGHGADCPELACLDCGYAVLLDPETVLPRPFRPALSSAA
jgi:hypothetical protein